MNKLDRYNFRFWDEDFGYKFCALGDEIPTNKSILDEYEQCTGIMDKNGKLIFEGDILKTLDGSICYVIWMGTSFWLKSPGSEAKDWEYDSFYEHCEVIGNIHENPELLKESK